MACPGWHSAFGFDTSKRLKPNSRVMCWLLHSQWRTRNRFIPIRDYGSLIVDSTNAAWLQYNVCESDGTTNLTVNTGSVTLWFAPSWSSTNAGGSGPGG